MQRWSESAKALAWYSKGVASGEAARGGSKTRIAWLLVTAACGSIPQIQGHPC